MIHGRVLRGGDTPRSTPLGDLDQVIRLSEGNFLAQPQRSCSGIADFTSITLATHNIVRFEAAEFIPSLIRGLVPAHGLG